MAQRLFMEAGRVILSRPGYDASPSLPNERKIFDSEWGYAGSIIASGDFSDPSTPEANPSVTTQSVGFDVIFPTDVGFIPTVILYEKNVSSDPANPRYRAQEFYLNGQPANGRLFNIVVGTDRITFNRNPTPNGGFYWRYQHDVHYQVFSWN